MPVRDRYTASRPPRSEPFSPQCFRGPAHGRRRGLDDTTRDKPVVSLLDGSLHVAWTEAQLALRLADIRLPAHGEDPDRPRCEQLLAVGPHIREQCARDAR